MEAPRPTSDHAPDQLTRRHALWGVLASGAMISQIKGEVSDRSTAPPRSERPRHMTESADFAINRGLAWLAERQQADGGFGNPRTYSRNVGVCALCGLAFLPQGIAGRFQQQIRGCTDYLLQHARPSGQIIEDDVVTHAPMFGHGFATTYLAQVYGMDLRDELKTALKRAVSLILAAQDASGAWRYTPFPDDGDVSVTTCQMIALASARQAGIAVPVETIQRSIQFLRQCQNPDGGFRYRLIDPPESLLPRSAAAVVALHAVGLHDDPLTVEGRRYLADSSTNEAPNPSSPHAAEYYFYGRYYKTHAAWQVGGEVWDQWYPVVREDLLQRQSRVGHWHDPNIGDEYATAMALLTLQFPFATLPLYLL